MRLGVNVEQVINALVLGAVYCLFAVGLSLTWGMLNVLDLAHGAAFMFSAFTCYLVTQRMHDAWPIPVLFGVAVVVGIVVGAALYMLVFRPIKLRSKTTSGAEMSMLIGSIGASAIMVGVAQNATAGLPFTLTAVYIPAKIYHLTKAVYVSNIEIIIVVCSLALTTSIAVWIQRTRGGRAMRALAVDSSTSGLMGISETRMAVAAFAISGASAGAAAVFLTLFIDGLTATSGSDLLLKAFAVVVLGGVGSMWGTMLAAFVLAAGEVLVTATTSGIWTSGVSFAIIILVLLLRPSGLFGAVKGQRA